MNLSRIVPVCTALALLAIGILLFRDYGISTDEPISRLNGLVSVRYVLKVFHPAWVTGELNYAEDLYAYRDKDYGVGFEMAAYAGERLLGLTTTRAIYMYRHLMTYLVFAAGVMAVYGVAARRHGLWQAGLLGAGLLYFSPRFFADGFYNDKDAVFMAAMAIAAFTMTLQFQRPSLKTTLLHALATAWALDIRVMAILFVPATAFLLGTKIWRDVRQAKPLASLFVCYAITAFVIHVATFPYLWADPFGHFVAVFKIMSNFNRWHGLERYFGVYIDGTHPPWHYALVWIGITTPLLILALFLSGAVATVGRVLRETKLTPASEGIILDFVLLGFALAPLAAVILLHSILYDGWRHLYFIYPFIILIAVSGAMAIWKQISNNRLAAGAALAVLAAHFIILGAWMWKVHPYQNVYFNALAKSNFRQNFEMDYWGLADRAAVEYILKNDPSPFVSIAPASLNDVENAPLMLTEEQKKRVHIVRDFGFSTYLLTNYKRVDDLDDSWIKPNYDLYYHLDIDGQRVLSVYRKKAGDAGAAW